MEQLHNLQDVVRCNLCEEPNPELHCAFCQINLCKTCAGEHLLDESKIHTVIPIKQRRLTSHYPTCPKHSTKQCELHCEKCDIPICIRCVSSEEHAVHKAEDIMATFQSKKETIEKDIKNLIDSVLTEYPNMAYIIKIQKVQFDEEFQTLLKVINKRRDDWYRERDSITQREITKVNLMRTECMNALDQWVDEIKNHSSKIKQYLSDLSDLIHSNDVCETICIPTFSSQEIDTKQLKKLFGALSE